MTAVPRRSLGLELALVVLVSLAVLVPGIWRYSLVDPWETHYGEVAPDDAAEPRLRAHRVARRRRHPNDNEGFRCKPVLTFWMMAAGMQAVGVADDGGYSGEMVARRAHDDRASGCRSSCPRSLGLTLMWWMLARLVNRRLAWLALLVVGSSPFFCLVARQAIPDMPLVASRDGRARDVHDGDRGRRAPDRPAFTLRVGGGASRRRAPRRARPRRRLRASCRRSTTRSTSSRRRSSRSAGSRTRSVLPLLMRRCSAAVARRLVIVRFRR